MESPGNISVPTRTRSRGNTSRNECDSVAGPPVIKTYEEKFGNLFGDGNTRVGNREVEEHRPVFMKTGLMTDMRGSSYVEQGGTKVLCWVSGPTEVLTATQEGTELGTLAVQIRFAPFAKPREESANGMEVEEKVLASRLQRTLETVVCRSEFPNLQLCICANIIEADGSCFPVIVNAASLAIADSRVPMFDLIAGVSIGFHGDLMLTDLTEAEAQFCQREKPPGDSPQFGTLDIAYLPTHALLSDFYVLGQLEMQKVSEGIEIAISNCKSLIKLQQQMIRKSVDIAAIQTASPET